MRRLLASPSSGNEKAPGAVVLTDRLRHALLAQAKAEHLLNPKYLDVRRLRRNPLAIQQALSLIVLHEHVWLADYFLPGEDDRVGEPLLPELEESGDVRRLVGIFPIGRMFVSSGANWYDRRDPKVFVKALDLVETYRPMVISAVARKPNPWVARIASTGLLSCRKVVSAILDYAYGFYSSDDDLMQTSFVAHLGDAFVEELKRDLTSQTPREGLNMFDEVLFGAIWHAEQFDEYRQMSQVAAAPVAGASAPLRVLRKAGVFEANTEAVRLARTFAVVRVALTDEGFNLPRIEGVRHALRLRRDPGIASLRARLGDLHGSFATGDAAAVQEARREVQRANAALGKAASLAKWARWGAIAGLPIGIVETLTVGLPVASLPISLISLFSDHASQDLIAKNRWILVG